MDIAHLTDDELKTELCSWAAKVAAGEARLLLLIGELDAREVWAEHGVLSCAHWVAWRLGVSRTTVQSRIEKLERQGVIAGYTVRVHDEVERAHIRAHIMITVLPKQMPQVVKALQAIPEVRELHSVSGHFDLVALGVAGSVGEMDVLTDRIGALDGVERTTSAIVLATKFER